MSMIQQITGIKETRPKHSHQQKENKMKLTVSTLSRWSGLSAMAAGILFVVIQAIHPPDTLASVPTTQWAIVHSLGVAMGLFGLFGITGLYARQIAAAGWLGLVGYLLFSLFWAFTLAFQFIEAVISPVLAAAAPQVVEGLFRMINNQASTLNLGALPMVWMFTGLLYMLGGLLFGSATFRAGILPRWASGLLAFSVVLPLLAASFVPHPFDRLFAVPVGIALAGLGYALWAEQREPAARAVPGAGNAQLRATNAE